MFGRSGVERAKSTAILILFGLLTVSLWQASIERAQAAEEDQSRQAASDVARRFAIALTTYDYVHLDVQNLRLKSVSSSAISDRVVAASQDVTNAMASSIGEVADLIVLKATRSGAEVLVWTSQVVAGKYIGAAAVITGVLEIWVSRFGSRWLVSNYHWLIAPGEGS